MKLYDRGKISVGIAIFLIAVISPFWYNALTGRASYIPQLNLPTHEKQCVESTPYMRANHTELLNLWKERVVRTGERTYGTGDGKTFVMSLTGTCMKCHSNKDTFCDRCHAYVNVQPKCWACHVAPKAVALTAQ